MDQWRRTGFEAETPFLMDKNATHRAAVSHTRQVLRDANPKEVAEILNDPTIRRNVAAGMARADHHARQDEPHVERPAPAGPSFIDLVVRANSTLIELESMVRGWRGPRSIPKEFSAASFDDIAEKAMRIKDTVNALRAATNDEFQDIVRNFREVTSDA